MMVDALQGLLQGIFGSVFPLVWDLLKIVLIIAPLLLCVAYLTFWERKVIGWMQVRIGPNRVGPWGLIQPIADGLKLLLKEVVIPTGADKSVFLLAPMFAFAPALAAWAVVPFNDTLVLANVNASLLYIMSITSIGVYGIILGLGLEFEIRLSRGHALRSPDDFVRSCHGAGAGGGADGFEQPQPRRHRERPGARAISPIGGWDSCRGTGCRCCRCLSFI
jgi:hypothetical protein